MDKDKIKMIRLKGKSLDLADELVQDFKKQGLRATWTSVVNSAIPLMHATMISKRFTMVSNAELRHADSQARYNPTQVDTLC